MSEFFKWDAGLYSVKVPEMDQEHIVLIDKMNALYTAHSENAPKETISVLLNDFAAYTAHHFQDEEAYMAKIAYPGIEPHKLLHKKLLEQVNDYVTEFNETGELHDRFFRFLTGWLATHIRGNDIKYGPMKRL